MSDHKMLSPAQSPAPVARFEVLPAGNRIALREYLNVLLQYRKLVILIFLTVFFGGLTYAYIKPARYEGNMLIYVSEMPTAEQKNLLGQVAPHSEIRTAAAEVELLRSRMIVGSVVEDLQLYNLAIPMYFPIIGSAIAHLNEGLSVPGLSGFGGYCWGEESVDVSEFSVPPTTIGFTFVVTVIDKDHYRLQGRRSGIDVVGRIGTELVIGSESGQIKLNVRAISGRTGAAFIIRRQSTHATVDAVRRSLLVSELGKQSGMINVTFSDNNPDKVRSVLTSLGSTYLRLVQSQKEQGTIDALAVLNAKLPILKHNMEIAEGKYEEYRSHQGATDVAEETRLGLGRQSMNQLRLTELRQKRAELSVRLGSLHPQIEALDYQIHGLENEVASMTYKIQRLPTVSKELERRARQMKADTDLYYSVLQKAEEMNIVAKDKSNNVRMVDEAIVPDDPIGSRSTIIMFSAALGLFLGIFGGFARKMLDG